MILAQSDALLVIDVQNDFLPGGALNVPGGRNVIAPINRMIAIFPHVIVTQDWHTPDHSSFATRHPGKAPFDTVAMPYGPQILWPDHCVQGTPGADLAPGLDARRAGLLIRKGHAPEVDSYSAFLEADRTTRTGLAGYLRERGIARLFLCGLATDFCVLWSALDARADGFAVVLVEDAVAGIDRDGSVGRALAIMEEAGVSRIASGAITGSPDPGSP
ncbi:bifunctional nicotinamidase/pyrazinamidase [Methylobacterium durans]|uniref:bifunctional nicotinamidase/pyrazinamidase n=1 Tax=Methylobacterium durans TaxID=2202825 RepID=UPI002B002A8D|nr:bifunctional nicotinamidase/pyrazinamidase [Methylobacterium durans]MEA1834670.1 bifunctional nicotinamidase/pyrazinamidase [Methylobacterium durans]